MFTRFGLKSVFGSCFSPCTSNHFSGCRKCKKGAGAGDCEGARPCLENTAQAVVSSDLTVTMVLLLMRPVICVQEFRPRCQQEQLRRQIN